MSGAGTASMQCTSVVLPCDDELEANDNETIDNSANSDWVEAVSSADLVSSTSNTAMAISIICLAQFHETRSCA